MTRIGRIILILLLGVQFAAAQSSLKDVYKDDFLIGAALSPKYFGGDALVERHFNSLTAENVMKWALIHPAPERYDFTAADKFVEYGTKRGMTVIGHTLVWHNQTPKWVFEDDKGKAVGRDELLRRMREHIETVVKRYKGKVKGWDVVNEALNDDGTMRQSPWFKIIGPDFVEKAFEYARAADPDAELYYNDYSLEESAKRAGAVKLVKNLKSKGLRVDGIGTQGHWSLDHPSASEIETTIKEFGKLGKVMVTELDVDVLPSPEGFTGAEISVSFALLEQYNPYKNGLPDAVQAKLSKRYGEIFRIFLKQRKNIGRVTFWGVTDADSWKNNFPVRGRTNYPLLFDRGGRTKPAFDAVIAAQRQ